MWFLKLKTLLLSFVALNLKKEKKNYGHFYRGENFEKWVLVDIGGERVFCPNHNIGSVSPYLSFVLKGFFKSPHVILAFE